MSEYYLGIDLHKKFAFWTLIDKEGNILKKQQVEVDIRLTREAAKCLPPNTEAAFEPVGDFLNYSKVLKEEGVGVKAAIPGKVKAIAWNRLKNDKVDSEILAQLLRTNLLPYSEIKEEKEYQLRDIVRLRNNLVRMRSHLKQKITLIEGGLAGLSDVQKWQKEKLSEVKDSFNKQIKEIDGHLKEVCENNREMQIISSIPGCGLIAALVIKSEVGDFSRFGSPGKLAAWAGLVPSSRDSGGKTKRGHITHQGSKWMRYILYEAAMNVKERNGNELFLFYKRIAAKGSRRKARVALAKKILCLIWHLIKKNELYVKQNRLDLGNSLAFSFEKSCTID